MRVSTAMIFESGVANLQRRQAELIATQQQLATGRRILTPADDPIGTAQALQLTQADDINTQLRSNRDFAIGHLDQGETAIAQVVELVQSIREQAINAGSGIHGVVERRSIANDINGLYEQIIGIANSTDAGGNYLFSGFQGTTQPFARVGSGVQYVADDGQRLIQVGASRQLAINVSGADTFERIRSGNGSFSWSAAEPLRSAQGGANAGSGIIGPANASNPGALTGHSYQINFTSATTYDVVDLSLATTILSAQPYVPANGASVTFDGIQVDLSGSPASGDTFSVNSAVNAGSATIGPGSVTNPALLTGHDYQINFTVAAGLTTYDVVDVSVSPATTVLAAQPYTGAAATISFDGLSVQLQGDPANGDSFRVAPSTDQSLFATVQDLINALNFSGSRTALANRLAASLTNLDQGLERLLEQRIAVGTRLRELDTLNTAGDELGLQYQTARSKLTDVDYARAISDLTLEQNSLDAARKSFALITQSTLFDYL